MASKGSAKQEKLLRMYFDNAPVGIVTAKKDGKITGANQMSSNIFGIAGEDFLQYEIFDLINDRHMNKALEHFRKVLNEGFAQSELMANSKPNAEIWLDVFATKIDENELVYYFIDRTDEKKAKEKLQQERSRYKALVDNQTDLVCRWFPDEGLTLTFVNEAFSKFFGVDEDQAIGMKWIDFIPTVERDKIKERYKDVGKNPKTISVEHRVVGADGKIYWQHWIDCPIVDDRGKIIEYQSVGRDITSQIEYQGRLDDLIKYDQLTGLYNRSYFENEMKKLDNRAQLPISLIMVDLNGLKFINDTFGQKIGDEMMKVTTRILKECCNEKALLARWGGDELVIFMPRTSFEKAKQISEKIYQKSVTAYVEGKPVSISIGTGTKAKPDKSLRDALKEAEDEMYKHKLTESWSDRNVLLNAILRALEAKSFETETHVQRMKKNARKIGENIDLPISELNRLSLLTILHDIGKINISENILTKKGPLTEEEWEIIKRHPEIGYKIASATKEFAHIAQEILAHHERWDGKGYPQGLKGKDIPLLARITAIADSYDVMSNGRAYKNAMSREEIMAEFKRCAGTQFDPDLVEVFLEILKQDGVDN